MLDAAPAIFVALEGSGLGQAIRQSIWLYMTRQCRPHRFAGRVRGRGRRDGRAHGRRLRRDLAAHVVGRARLLPILAFCGLLLTGAMLFTAEASHVIMNAVFQVKLALIALGLVNVAVFEFVAWPKVQDFAPLTPLPAAARNAGIVSIAIWIAVAACGRTIAYF